MNNIDKLKKFIKSLPPSDVEQAICLIAGSLVTTCKDGDMDLAIEVAKGGLEEIK